MLDPPAPLPPHPRFAEVLYAVPTGAAGDASGDGVRDATGDEFFELENATEAPVQLKGYEVTDRNEGTSRLRFVFPALELAPGERALVFNGNACVWRGPVGDETRAPAARHPEFAGAWVFTLRAPSSRIGLANSGDYLLLRAPSGEAVSLVHWGTFEAVLPEADVVEPLPMVSGESVHRTESGWAGHLSIDGVRFSPGGPPAKEADGPKPPIGPPIDPGEGR